MGETVRVHVAFLILFPSERRYDAIKHPNYWTP